ncbi:transglutaminase-like cysteine peptidase [uncultured Azonexus sp.]|uniref:transglutaminase-like cysteine peptidase n=1 Tax=uncultured Azonexus sp. TaxID=520307 RepID=UPI002601F076|nr:transglutaminase-like cysteine peptidase [uncultured Azonexus sp.]
MPSARPGLITLLLLAWIGLGSAFGLDFERLRDTLLARHGQEPLALFEDWQRMLGSARGTGEQEQVRRVNDFFNQRIAFDDDYSLWGQTDYWATPLETMAQRRGDCEDFSISKYFSLLELGIPVSKLRLVYVRATQAVPGGGSIQQAHMVLAYYPRPNADPLVLDNLNKRILPASQRHDLSPVFSFNSAGLWQGTGNQTSRSNLSRWQDLLARARAEGFQ